MKIQSLKKFKVPHVFVLLTSFIFICSLLTYIIPSGLYERQTIPLGESTRTVVVPDTYKKLDKEISLNWIILGSIDDDKARPVSIINFLTAIPRGMVDMADIIFLVFIVGGVLGILQRTGTITAMIQSLLNRFSGSGTMLTIILMVAT